jgi:hypothetical protein
MFDNLTFPWQIFNTYSGRQRNSLIYKYYIEIQTLRIFTSQFSIERVSISATVESTRYGLSTVTCPVYINTLLAYMKTYICIKRFWYLQTFLTMMAAMLKFMFIYNELMILDDKSFRKCVCVFEATLTRSKINLEFVYLCKSGSLRFSQFSGCWLILSVYIIMSFDFPFVRLFGVR